MFGTIVVVQISNMNKNPRCSLFYNHIATPDQDFVDQFLKLFGVYLMAGNHKWYIHLASAMLGIYIFDIVAFDRYLDERHPEYNAEHSELKVVKRTPGKRGRPPVTKEKVSMRDVIARFYGSKGCVMVEYLINSNFELTFDEYCKIKGFIFGKHQSDGAQILEKK